MMLTYLGRSGSLGRVGLIHFLYLDTAVLLVIDSHGDECTNQVIPLATGPVRPHSGNQETELDRRTILAHPYLRLIDASHPLYLRLHRGSRSDDQGTIDSMDLR